MELKLTDNQLEKKYRLKSQEMQRNSILLCTKNIMMYFAGEWTAIGLKKIGFLF